MFSKLDIPPHGPSINIVRRCRADLSDVLQSKFECVATFEGVDFDEDRGIAQKKRPTVAPEKRLDVKLRSGVQVSVWKADLTNFPVDAVVNAANDGLGHYGGLALALSEVGGPQIQRESDDYIAKYGNLSTGDAVVMDAGSLPCKKIIHAVGPHLSKHASTFEVSQAESLLERAICNILNRVKENQLKTVAIPAISSGLFNYPLRQCAETIVSTVKTYYEKSYGYLPKEIMLVNHDEPTVLEMQRAGHLILCNRQPTSSSQAVTSKSRGGAEPTALTVQVGNAHLTLKKGAIQDQQADVIVNTIGDNTYRDLNSGLISKALLQKAGYEMQKEINKAPLTGHGRVIITKSYKLKCNEVYHTFCHQKGRDAVSQIETGKTLLRSVRECLWLAATNHHKSIAFPAIGTGGLGFEKKEVAQIMSDAVIDFGQNAPEKLEVYFVIFPSDDDTFKAFEEQMRYIQKKPPLVNFTRAPEVQHREDIRGSRASTPQISLSGPSDVATHEAKQWLQDLLIKPSGSVVICNNFIQHFGMEEHRQLSCLMKKGVSIEECFARGHASIIIHSAPDEDVAVAGLQVEAMLYHIQREFVREESGVMRLMLNLDQKVSSERKAVDKFTPEFADRASPFRKQGLQVVKVDKVENPSLELLFDLKKKHIKCTKSRKMFQCIPLQFCEMVSRIGFHAEFAPPDDPAYGEGIYFASTVEEAMKVWKEPSKDCLHFVEAEVVPGPSIRGERGFILPPVVKTDSGIVYNSVTGGPDISVIFSGYQALPKYIITCKKFSSSKSFE